MLAGLYFQLRACSLDTLQDRCHLWVSSVGNGCHVANGCHLTTLRLDTALIDDVGHAGVVGEVVLPPRAPAGPAGVSWSSTSRGGLVPCRARLSGKGGPSLGDILILWLGVSGLVSLSCMLAL